MSDDPTLRLASKLRAQLARVAKKVGMSPERLASRILEEELPRKEIMADFVREALASDAEAELGKPVYRAEDVHVWMERLAAGERPARPKPAKH